MPRAVVPTEVVQAFLMNALNNLGHVPLVLLVDQEAFRSASGETRLPSIIHTVSNEFGAQTARRYRPTKYEFTIRIHTDGPDDLDSIHAEIERLGRTVNARLTLRLISAGRNTDPAFNWRILSLLIPARGGILLPRPAQEDAILWPPGNDRLTFGVAEDRLTFP